ncbi:MAG: ABC transporter permease, partial [Thermoplasmata archaeon]|nr:ABC transporter permease [Thermoplasmata archaeon]
MLLKTLTKKIRAEKRGLAIFLVFLLLSIAFNFSLSIIGSAVQIVDSLSSAGDTQIVAENASLEEIEKYGEVVDYAYYDTAKMQVKGKSITVFVGYGEFKTLDVKSPGPDEAVVLGMNIPVGEKVEINGKTYTVSKSLYYPSTYPFVLIEYRGKTLFVLMKARDFDALSNYLVTRTKVLQFNTWKDGEPPWEEEIEEMKNFSLSLFGLVLGPTLLIILLLSITHILGELRGVGIMKAIGMPESFITYLFTGDYLIFGSLGYPVGIFIGITLGAYYNDVFVSLPFSLNTHFLGIYNLIVYIAFIIFTLLPLLYVKRVRVVNALRGGFAKISRLKYGIVFALLFFGILTPFTVSQNFMEVEIDVPFEVMIGGDVSSINIGEKAGTLWGVKVENLYTQAYFLGYNSSFKSTVIQGRWFSSPEEVVVGYGIAKKCHFSVGDTIKINLVGEWENYRVVGISSCPMNDYQALYLPKVNYVPDSIVFLNRYDEDTLEILEKEGYEIYTKEDIVEQYYSLISTLNTLL